MDIILKAESLSKKFGKKLAVDHVNMQIHKGEIYGFIGRNGAGKTTFMRLILGLAFPTSGEIELFGNKALNAERHRIGSLIETPSFYGNCSAYENMKRFSLLFNASDADITYLLKLVGLDKTGSKKVSKFSLGMKQRLGLAVALLGNPEFVILDEPINGLDPVGIKEIRGIIQHLNREKGTTFLISSHLLDELSKIATRYGIINDGVLIEEISTHELLEKCKPQLKISTNDPSRTMAIILSNFADAKITNQNQTVVFSGCIEDIEGIKQILLSSDIDINKMEIVSNDLENYFIQKLGDENEELNKF